MHTFRLFQAYPQVVQGIFDKHTGNVVFKFGQRTHTLKSRQLIKKIFPAATLIELNQMHSSIIVPITLSNAIKLSQAPPQGDGLITQMPNILLMLKTADCFPLFIFDPNHHVIGLIHVGWRGAVKGIHLKAIDLMKTQFHSHPQDILVGVGPGICSRCYRFEDKPEQADDPNWQPFITKKDNQWHVDIRGFVISDLKKAGITNNHLEVMNECTFENKNFFSHQRSKMTGELEGRFANIIGLRND